MISHVLVSCLLAALATAQGQGTPSARILFENDVSIQNFSFADKGKTLIYADENGFLRARDLKRGETKWEYPFAGSDRLPNVGVSVGSKLVVAACANVGYTGRRIDTGKGGSYAAGKTALLTPTCIVCDPRDRWVWIGAETDVMTRLTVGDVNGWSTRGMHNGGVTSIALDGKGKLLAVGGQDSSIRFIDSKSAKRDDKTVFAGPGAWITALEFGAKGSTLASGDKDGGLRLLKVSNGKLRRDFVGHEGSIKHIVFHPKNSWMASGDEQGVVIVWDLKSGDQLVRLKVGQEAIAGLDTLDKGKTLVGACGKRLTAWDLSDL